MMKPNCRMLPNEIYDLFPEMSEAEIKVVMTIWGETFSVGRANVALTNEEIGKISGLSSNAVISGIKGCLETHQLIVRFRDGHSYRYALKLGDDVKSDPVQEEEPKKKLANPTWLMMVALAKVTKIPLSLRTNQKKLGAFAKELLEGGFTPEHLETAYGERGRYWVEDWRAKQSNPPTPPNMTVIRETITRYSGGSDQPLEKKQIVTTSDGGAYV